MRTITKQTSYIILAACVAAIFIFLNFFYHRLNPFHLAGKQFLGFYSLLILVTLGNVLLLRQQHPRLASQVNIFCLLLGIARLIQGVYHHKPVGFLLLLLLFPIITAFRLRARSNPA